MVADEQPVSLEDIGRPSLKLVSRRRRRRRNGGHNYVPGRPIGHVMLNVPGDGLFEEERDKLIEFAEKGNEAQCVV